MKIYRLWRQIADVAKEPETGRIGRLLAVILTMPGIDLGLQLISPCEEPLVRRRKIAGQPGKASPRSGTLNPGVWERLFFDEVMQDRGDEQSAGLDTAHSDAFLQGHTRISGSCSVVLPRGQRDCVGPIQVPCILLYLCQRLRPWPASSPVEELHRVNERHAGASGDLGDATDVARGDDVGAGAFDIRDLAVP